MMKNEQAQGKGLDDGAIESLAVQYGLDEALVRQIYEKEFEVLKLNARIKSFLPILCSRRVKQVIVKDHFAKTRTG